MYPTNDPSRSWIWEFCFLFHYEIHENKSLFVFNIRHYVYLAPRYWRATMMLMAVFDDDGDGDGTVGVDVNDDGDDFTGVSLNKISTF